MQSLGLYIMLMCGTQQREGECYLLKGIFSLGRLRTKGQWQTKDIEGAMQRKTMPAAGKHQKKKK